MITEKQVWHEVLRRFQVWEWQGAPRRKYVLVVANHYAQEEWLTAAAYCRPSVDRHLRELLVWVKEAADRPLTHAEEASRVRCADAMDFPARNGLYEYPIAPEILPPRVSNDLRLALTDPIDAAARLLRRSRPADASSWYEPGLLAIMECLWPASWDHATPGWEPPREAVAWARRMYDRGDFSDLPILADMLEDAGCPDRPLLDHCRHHARHFRGCAAIDRLLGLP